MKSNYKVGRVLSVLALLLIALVLSACSMGDGTEATVGDTGSDRSSPSLSATTA